MGVAALMPTARTINVGRDEPNNSCHIQGQNSPGGTARGSDGAGAGEAARHSPDPDLWLEEAASRQRGEPFRARRKSFGGWRGGTRARDGEALYQDWSVDTLTGFLCRV